MQIRRTRLYTNMHVFIELMALKNIAFKFLIYKNWNISGRAQFILDMSLHSCGDYADLM